MTSALGISLAISSACLSIFTDNGTGDPADCGSDDGTHTGIPGGFPNNGPCGGAGTGTNGRSSLGTGGLTSGKTTASINVITKTFLIFV